MQLQKLVQLVNQYAIDTLHIHFGIFHGLILKHRCAFKGKKILIHDHMDFPAGDAQWRQSKRNSWIYAWIYRLLHIGYVAVSAQKYAFFNKIVKRCWYMPNGLSFERNTSVSLGREASRREMGVDETQKLCLFLGWSLDTKGLDVAIKAVNEYRKKHSDLILAIVGFGKLPSQKAVQYIEEKTGIPADSAWIRYLESTEDMYAYHKAADVYLSASRTESFSYGLLEAISQNTPVVVSDIQGTRWAWEYTKCFPYPVEDHALCSDALEKAIHAGQAASNACDIAARYNIQDWCKKMIDIYAD